MINIYEVVETNNMIEKENLDVRTITLGISLLDCIDSDLVVLNEKIYQKIYDAAKDHAKAVKQGKDTAAEIGLTGRKLNKKDIEDNDKTMYENKKIKRLTFKTQFISEGHMLSKVPDDLKVEGKRFIMRDTADNEYLVEWKSDKPEVTKKLNMTLVNEQKERMKQLWGYKSTEAKTSTSSFRIQEDKGFSDMVNKARKLM